MAKRFEQAAAEPASARLLDAYQVSAMLGCARMTLLRRWARGEMPAPVKIGNLLRWRESDLRAWLESLQPAPPPKFLQRQQKAVEV